MYATQDDNYDVVIMGAGFAGLCQARHLMLKIPNIRVALVAPCAEEPSVKEPKIGESALEIAALFLAKELGLHEYLIENHLPKQGLNFHWTKAPNCTETLDDYYGVFSNRQPSIPCFQVDRAKLERDLIAMNKKMGAAFYSGQVSDVDLTPGDDIKTVEIELDGQKTRIQGQHIIDAACGHFIPQKKDNLLTGSENLPEIGTGSAWMRVEGIERQIFHSGYDPLRASTSHYYATNHYLGNGHWVWMIPTDGPRKEISIGIIHHHSIIPAEMVNSENAFREFLDTHHRLLARLIDSGQPLDFHYSPSLAHRNTMMFYPDNCYVIDDAAYLFDTFYAHGTSALAIAIESVTELIRASLAGEGEVEQKRTAYNEFNLAFARSINYLYRGHGQQLSHASIMSWRIYWEFMWWFGVQVPLYVGKWHLDLTFIPLFIQTLKGNGNGLFADLSQELTDLAQRGVNIGLMDCYRGDQMLDGYYPQKYFDDFLENTKLEPLHCNVYAGFQQTCFHAAIWYALLQGKAFGLRGWLNPHHIYHFVRLLGLATGARVAEFIYKLQTSQLPANSEVAAMRQEFKGYRYQPVLQPWSLES